MQRSDTAEIRIKFGKVMKIWFSRNDWPQDVPHKLSSFIPTGGPWNSQISTAMSAKLDPKVGFFLACGEFNRVIAEQKFPGITDTRLISMITGATPLIGDDGQVFKATDFFALYTGILDVPIGYQLPQLPELTDLEAKRVCEKLRETFVGIARRNMFTSMEAWKNMEPALGSLTEAQKSHFRDVLSGWADYTAEELNAMPANDTRASYSPELLLLKWGLENE